MSTLHQNFTQPLDPRLQPFLIGGGRVDSIPEGVRLTAPASTRYTNAQLSDYQAHRRRRDYPWRAPLRLTVRARFSHPAGQMGGTFGFGFWNNPLTLTGGGVLAAPRALWFFGGAPPHDMVLVPGVPGGGWKATVLDAGRWPGWLFAPAAGAGAALTLLPGLGRPILALGRRLMAASDAVIPPALDITAWHTYAIDWRADGATFTVDGDTVLAAPHPPAGPLGLVIWVDNQYAIVSESGKFRFGVTATAEPHWLDLASVVVEALA